MSEGIGIWRCKACGTTVFPQRLLCPHCHGQDFNETRVHEGVVEEVAVIRHMIGQENWQPRRIANVRTRGGPSITVGLRDMLTDAAYDRVRGSQFRMHYQYVMANDRRAPYDYFMLICGPVPVTEWAADPDGVVKRFGERAELVARMERSVIRDS